MAKWLIIDRLYNAESYWMSHLDSYGHYIEAMGHEVHRLDISESVKFESEYPLRFDVVFALEGYGLALKIDAKVRIAQVACDLEVPRGFDAIVSSIPALVEKYKARGDNAIYMSLAFDGRARVAGMGVQRDLDCIFIGTTGPNHRRRTELLRELSDVVTVMPPVFGRAYFATLARAKVVFNVHAEWSRGAANNMRLFEGSGMGCVVVSDGEWPLPGGVRPFDFDFRNAEEARDAIELAMDRYSEGYREQCGSDVLRDHSYETSSRIPRLIELARSL